jgi:transposase
MEKVLAVYEKPYDQAQPVLCLDEKPISLHAHVRPPVAAKPGRPAKRDNEYKRCGTANVFGIVEPKAGRHFCQATPNRSGAEFTRVLEQLAVQYPEAKTIHLILDNLNIHCRATVVKHLGEETGAALWERFTVHYTPKHGSWLNQAEIELSMLSRQCLGGRRIASLEQLATDTKTWNRQADLEQRKIRWRFTRHKARQMFRYCRLPTRHKKAAPVTS